MRIVVLLKIFFLLFIISSVANAEVIKLGDKENYDIGLQVDLLEDKSKNLDIKDIIQSDKFKKSTSKSPNYGFSDSVVWCRITVSIPENNKKTWLLEIGYPLLDKVNFYSMKDNSYVVKRAGDTLPFSNREINHQNFVFYLDNAPGLYTYYIRVETTSSFTIPLKIWSLTSFISQINTEKIIIGIIIGAILIMLLYNFSMAIRIKEIAYVYYVVLGCGYLLETLVLNGTGFQYVWPNAMWLNDGAPLTIFFITASLYLFLRSFFKLKNYFKKLDTILFILAILSIIGALISFYIPYKIIVKIAILMAMLTAILGLVTTILCIIKKIPDAPFIFFAFISVYLGPGIVGLNRFGLIPSNLLTLWGFNLSFPITLALLSIGLSDQINFLKNKLAVLNVGLEQKVKERTEELEASYLELETMNTKLIAAKDALWGEMEMAKKIQTVLLPKNPVIKGYEIATYHLPADEVGGDYYDIINVEGRDWIVIGDVSGHGVPAGLIMMMVQTAIQVTLSQHPGMQPQELISVINKTITGNIAKISENKYMTITVFAVMQEGKFYFSGLHQDLLIFRAKENRVELIETNGIWIGLMDPITNMLNNDSFNLQLEDALLVFTDGLTEAVSADYDENNEGQSYSMYGQEKLNKIFLSKASASMPEIKEAILSSLQDYKCNDDVTFVIIKRKS